MNRHARVYLSAWIVAGLAGVAAVASWLDGGSAPQARDRTPWRRTVSPIRPVDTAGLGAAALAVHSRNLFRWDRSPAPVRFNPWEPVAGPGATPPARPSRPALILVGLLGGPPWTAMIEGIPGRESGVLLRVGETAGGIRLAEVREGIARLTGLDTTWVLTPRSSWR